MIKKIALLLISNNIPVPPKGWGAIEKYMWEYKINLEKLGYQVDLKWPNSPDLTEYDIVQVHTCNQALYLAEKNIPYIFSFDDTHVVVYGKNSPLYKKHIEAIQKSVLTIVHGEFLVDYFNEPNVVYLRHGANPDVFKNFYTPQQNHKLLCVGATHLNDRKGLLKAINVAKKMDLPLTIVGPNQEFFDKNPQNYDKLTLIGNTDDEGLTKLYNEHTIFLHPSNLETGHPNLTLVESLYCGTPVVGTCHKSLQGMRLIEPTEESLEKGIQDVISSYEDYVKGCIEFKESKKYDWFDISKDLLKYFEQSISMKSNLIKEYTTTQKLDKPFKEDLPIINISYMNGVKVSIGGCNCKNFNVKFFDHKTNKLVHEANIDGGMWTKPNVEYYLKWRIEIRKNKELILNQVFDAEDKKVYINLSSKALGDTIAWTPYVEEFRKAHKCKVVCSTFHNEFFKDKYPEIEFVAPGVNVGGLYASYSIGWFFKDNQKYDTSKHPFNPLDKPLQQTASDILGLPYFEVKPKLYVPTLSREIKEKYVVIAPHGTKHASYWHYPKGWQTLIDHLNSKGYKVVMSSGEPLGDPWHDSKLGGTLTNVIDKTGTCSLLETFSLISYAEALIGIGSGLVWTSWTLNIPTILISGFSEPYTEMVGCHRVTTPEGYCTGCFNKEKLDPGDWQWCPFHKGTDRHFECSKNISPSAVIEIFEKELNIY